MNHPNRNKALSPTEVAINALGIPMRIEYVQKTKREDWECFEWRVTLQDGQSYWSTPYYCGLGHVYKATHPYATDKPRAPSVADVLEALVSDADSESENFVDWCDNLGYSDDSIKALNTYKQCFDIARALRKFLGREKLEAVRAALRGL